MKHWVSSVSFLDQICKSSEKRRGRTNQLISDHSADLLICRFTFSPNVPLVALSQGTESKGDIAQHAKHVAALKCQLGFVERPLSRNDVCMRRVKLRADDAHCSTSQENLVFIFHIVMLMSVWENI